MNEIMPQLGRETVVHVREVEQIEEETPLDSTALDNSVYELPKAAE
jgi:hypothetical protein